LSDKKAEVLSYKFITHNSQALNPQAKKIMITYSITIKRKDGRLQRYKNISFFLKKILAFFGTIWYHTKARVNRVRYQDGPLTP
jgi:hypothetical protein